MRDMQIRNLKIINVGEIKQGNKKMWKEEQDRHYKQ